MYGPQTRGQSVNSVTGPKEISLSQNVNQLDHSGDCSVEHFSWQDLLNGGSRELVKFSAQAYQRPAL